MEEDNHKAEDPQNDATTSSNSTRGAPPPIPKRLKEKKDKLSSSAMEDPFNLHGRFIRTHLSHYPDALDEIRRGRKCSCWMWYIFPTPPWIVRGIEMGSSTNSYYSLRTDEQAHAYLKFESSGVNLRANYVEITTVVRDQLKGGRDVVQLFGCLDAPKLRSSIEYFEKIGGQLGDEELRSVCAEVMELLNEQQKQKKDQPRTIPRFGYRRTLSSSSSSSSDEDDEDEEDKKSDSDDEEKDEDSMDVEQEEEEKEKEVEEKKNKKNEKGEEAKQD